MPFRSAGINGYVGKRSMYIKKRVGKRKRRAMKFGRRINNIVRSGKLEKNIYSVLSTSKAQVAVNTAGGQASNLLATKLSGGDVIAIRGQINTNSGLTAGVGTFSTALSDFYVNAYLLQIMMKNQAQTNAIIDLYETVPRVASLLDPVTQFTAMVGAQLGSATDYNKWGWTPFQCPPFCQAHKIINKTRYLLAPGATEIIDIRDTRRQKIELCKYYAINDTVAATTMAVPRYTRHFWVIVRGEPTHDNTTKTLISTSSYDVDFVMREDYHYTYDMEEKNSQIGLLNNLGAVAAEAEILEPTGAVVAPAQA